MKYAIVFSSVTGNTEVLARAIRSVLPPEDCVYFGPPSPLAMGAELLYIGFWTNRGSCNEDIEIYLKCIQNKKVFLFGTAGFGIVQDYFDKIMESTARYLGSSNQLIGTYMCQGKLKPHIRQKYEEMKPSPRREMQLKNFDEGQHHPNAEDLRLLQEKVLQKQS